MATRRTRSRIDANIHSVASAARVSTATVSRTINGKIGVSPDLRERVWKAVKELAYVQAPVARSPGGASGKLLGLMITESVFSSFPHLLQHFEEAAFLQGYDLRIGTVNATNRHMDVLARHMIERGVTGVAILAGAIEQHLIDLFLRHGIRILLLTQSRSGPQIDTICIDTTHSADQAVQHLAVLGHRDIAFAYGQREDGLLELPPAAFSIAMRKIGIEVASNRIVQDSFDGRDELGALQALLRPYTPPTAIVCSSDLVALKTLRAIEATNLRVPNDVSIVGFGDIYLARHANPPLTTVQIPQNDLATYSIDFLRGTEGRSRETRRGWGGIGTNLIVRRSTSFPRNSVMAATRNADRPAR
jgi:LacI family transcriptional regulator